jgi:hypothetical protein
MLGGGREPYSIILRYPLNFGVWISGVGGGGLGLSALLCPLLPPPETLPFRAVLCKSLPSRSTPPICVGKAMGKGVEPLPIPYLDFVCTDRPDAPLYAGGVCQPRTAHHAPPDCLSDCLTLVKGQTAGLAQSSHRTTDINELPRSGFKHKGVKMPRLCLLNTEYTALLVSEHPLFSDLLGFGVADKPSIHGFTKCHAVRVSGVCLPVFGEPSQGGFGHLADGRSPPFAYWANCVWGLGCGFWVNFGELCCHTY